MSDALRKGRDDLLAQQFDRLLDQLRRHMAKPELGAEHVVAYQVMLLLDLADDCVGAADQGQAVVDPEIIGLGPLLEHPPQLKTLWCTRFPNVPAIWPISHA